MYLLRVCEATISTQRITLSPEVRMMENCEQSSASSLSLSRKPMGLSSAFPRSFTGSIFVMKAQVSRSLATASNSS